MFCVILKKNSSNTLEHKVHMSFVTSVRQKVNRAVFWLTLTLTKHSFINLKVNLSKFFLTLTLTFIRRGYKLTSRLTS